VTGVQTCALPIFVVVDDLDEHVPVGAGHDQARPLGRAEDLLPDPQMPAPALQRATARGLSGQGLGACHDYLPAFPTLRRTYSPSYRTPDRKSTRLNSS